MADAQEITYESAGVSTAEGARAVDAIKASVKATYRPEVIGDIGGFGGLFNISCAKGMEEPILVSGTDGVGTKLKIAQAAGIHNTVGIDLVAMCVNDILATGAEPLFFLDYIAIGKLTAQAAATIVEGIAEGCKMAGCALIGGEMAEHPGVMAADDYDLSGFCVGIVDKPRMLNPEHAQAGDVLIGLPSSGIHSNGYSLVRKVAFEGKQMEELAQPREWLQGASILEALLAPTRIYVRPVLDVLQKLPGAVHSLAHITGGGITENLNRALPTTLDARVTLGTWPELPIIKFVCEAANLSEHQALKTFNMGIGMVLVVAASQAKAVQEALSQAGEESYVIGELAPGTGNVMYA